MSDDDVVPSIWDKLGKKGTEGLKHINLDDLKDVDFKFDIGDLDNEKKSKSRGNTQWFDGGHCIFTVNFFPRYDNN